MSRTKLLNAVRKKDQVTHKGRLRRMTGGFSIKTLQVREGFKWWILHSKNYNFLPTLFYPKKKTSVIIEGERETFRDESRLARLSHYTSPAENTGG